jgi:Tol biopolymer transport system component
VRRLGGGDLSEVDPAWSPDGQRLAYVTANPSCEDHGGTVVWVADAGFTAPATLARQCSDDFLSDAHPVFSPDGQTVAVETGANDYHRIDLLAADGTRTTAVNSSATDPAWSPDGASLGFLDTDEIGGIASMPLSGQAERDWFASVGEGEIDDGGPRDLTWARDGSLLAFVRGEGVYVVQPGGEQPLLVAKVDGASHPSFSPDGRFLVFSAYTQSPDVTGAPYNLDLYVVGVDGSGLHAVTSTPYDDVDPAWRP